jgi:prevent-host-death family protein
MMSVNIHEAKTHFSKLIERVRHGEEITIAKGGRPVARLIPVEFRPTRRSPGSARGRVKIRHDFDAPLPKILLRRFE